MEETLPFALLYGVPYEQFWHLNPYRLRAFRTAYEKRLEQDNQQAWIQGLYIRSAVASLFSKKSRYPDKPFGMEQDIRDAEAEADLTARKFDAWAKVFNGRFEGSEKEERR